MSQAAALPQMFMTVDEFLKWESGDGLTYQLVDGQPVAMAPANFPHGLLQAELARALGNHLLEYRPECRMATAPGVVPALFSARNMRVPDLAVTCSTSDDLRAVPEPVLLVEILSPGNQAKTWANVWAYTTIPSVCEILVLRADMIMANLLRRHADATWPPEPDRIAEGDLVLESVDFRAPLVSLYRTTRLARPQP